MNSEQIDNSHLPVATGKQQDQPAGNGQRGSQSHTNRPSVDDASQAPDGQACREATALVRGETVQPSQTGASPKGASSRDADKKPDKNDEDSAPKKSVSEAKVRMQSRLPSLRDDSEVGVQKEQVVTRDGKADLAFTGTLVASAAPASAPKGEWQEYRIYETSGGKHVFSKITRHIQNDEPDAHEAEVFEPSPSTMPSQLLRSARDLTRSRPLSWADAAVAFFGYDPLAKTLYRKLPGRFEERIE